ncbi:hypothetical protein PTTG_28051 [Puccinia triticina 1-1 BBBD Race 1]|uniref:Uncharacterized protein n=1 Tax=Puccinia triticina (isolate 1-1 / race 1 (BBBD)) TaxID=630390 RepID=A0A180GEQ4_PUCT1|nr:hypothetical protein PTTG_28051 [Puccinia triticina 1-1 BBBD Race 1]WAR51968.1 hypothetical protein PtB15_1B405 [Puccinia triticina]
MPLVKITNRTSRPINVALSIIIPIHFHNELLPQQTWETQVQPDWCEHCDCCYSTGDHQPRSNCWNIVHSEQGLKEEELEKTLQETSTLLDGIKYLCLPNAADPTGKEHEQEAVDPSGTTETQAVETSKNALLGILTPEMLDRFTKFYSSKSDKVTLDLKPQSPNAEGSPTRQPQKSHLEGSPETTQSDSKSKGRNLRESPLDSLTSVFHDFSRFQRQNMKRRKGKSMQRKSDSDNVPSGDKDKTANILTEDREEEEDWELVESDMISRFNDQPTFNANETVYIGFNVLYQFEWHMNNDVKNNPGTRFKLVDTSM